MINGGVLTHPIAANANSPGLTITANSITVGTSSYIDVSGKGIAEGTSNTSFRYGGSHGGLGGYDTGTPDPVYGSYTQPNDFGKGSTTGSTGLGGGKLKLNTTTLTVNGYIRSNGTSSSYSIGSGGSIWINTTSLNGNGYIEARGVGSSFGSSSGGRIAIYYDASQSNFATQPTGSSSTRIRAFGGDYSVDKRSGQPGTIYLERSDGFKELRFDNSVMWNKYSEQLQLSGDYSEIDLVRVVGTNVSISGIYDELSLLYVYASTSNEPALIGSVQANTLTLNQSDVIQTGDVTITDFVATGNSSYGSWVQSGYQFNTTTHTMNNMVMHLDTTNNSIVPVSDLVVSGFTLPLSGAHSYNSVSVINGGVLTHPIAANANSPGLTITANSITVGTSSYIDVSGKGLSAFPGIDEWAGGSYGGLGGIHPSNSSGTNSVYGNPLQPNDFGTGSANFSNSNGLGGGKLKLDANVLTVNGHIRANGTSQSRSGGSGGSVWIITGELKGTGQIQANGASSSSGSGGGGRIAIYYYNLGNFILGSQVAANGGGSSYPGGAGTVYIEEISVPLSVASSSPIGLVSGFTTGFEVNFVAEVDQSSFDTSDVEVLYTAPQSEPQIIAVQQIEKIDSDTYFIHIVSSPAFLADGFYSVSVGPNISIPTNSNGMDQDNDGIFGEDPDDIYSSSFTIDNTPPVAPGNFNYSTLETNYVHNSTILLSGARENNTAVLINGVQRVPLGSGNWQINSLQLSQGQSSLQVSLVDLAGNQSPSVQLSFFADDQAPQFVSIQPANNAALKNLDFIVAGFSEEGSGIDISNTSLLVNNGAVTGVLEQVNASSIKFTPDQQLFDGEYQVGVELVDMSGNSSGVIYTSFVIDTVVPPHLNFTLNGKVDGTRVAIDWSAYNGSSDVSGIDHFELYRSATSFTNIQSASQVASIASTETSHFDYLGESALGNTYHYALVPVDRAGNFNPLIQSKSVVVEEGANISGVVTYSGIQTGNITIRAQGLNHGLEYKEILSQPGSYSLDLGFNDIYEIVAYIDSPYGTQNIIESWEAQGSFVGNPLIVDGYKTNIDITIHDTVTNGTSIVSYSPDGSLSEAVAFFDVTFAEPIRSASFTLDDVNITGTNGVGAVIPLSITKLNALNYRINLPLLEQDAIYTLSVGPNIENLPGWNLDQNLNGISGEIPSDIFQASFEIDAQAPASPVVTNHSTTQTNSINTNQIILSGTKESNSSIWQRTTSGSVLLVALSSDTAWESESITLNQGENIITIFAKDMAGNESADVGVTFDVDSLPSEEVTGLVAISNESGANLNWQLVEDNERAGINVYQEGVLLNQTPLAAATQTYSIHGLTAGIHYQIKVTTLDGIGNESSGQSIVIETLLPNPTLNAVVETFSNRVSLSWNEVSGASGYRLFAETTDMATNVSGLQGKLYVEGGAITSAQLGGLENETPYFFNVVAVNINGSYSNTTNSSQTATPGSDSAGPVLSNLQFKGQAFVDGTIITSPGTLTINAVDESGIAYIEYFIDGVLYKSSSDATQGNIFSALINPLDFVDGTHVLQIKAFDTIGHQSLFDDGNAQIDFTIALSPPAAPNLNYPASGITSNTAEVAVKGSSQLDTRVQLKVGGADYGSPIIVDSFGYFDSNVTLPDGTGVTSEISAVAFYSDRPEVGNSISSNIIEVTVDNSIPNAPSGLNAASLELGEVRIVWDAVTNVEIAGYRIYRSETLLNSISGEVPLNGTLNKKLYFVDLVDNDGIYFYYVVAVGENNLESALSAPLRLVVDHLGPKVTNITYESNGLIDQATGAFAPAQVVVNVTFDESLRSTPYMAIVPNGGIPIPVKLDRNYFDENTYTGNFEIYDTTPSGVAYAVVAAYDQHGNRGTEIENGLEILIDSDGPDIVNVELTPVSPINNDTVQTISFTISVNDEIDLGKPYALIPKIDGAAMPGLESGVSLTALGINNNLWQWSGLFDLPVDAGLPANGQHLGFDWIAKDKLNNVSQKILANPGWLIYQGDLPKLNAPAQLNAYAAVGGTVKLEWIPSTLAHGYKLYRSASCNLLSDPNVDIPVFEIDKVDVVLENNRVSFNDQTGLIDGYGYCYKVAALNLDSINGTSSLSLYSNGAEVLVDATAPNSPTNLQVSLTGSGLYFSWEAPTDAESGEYTYNLYRFNLPDESVQPDVSSINPIKSLIPAQAAGLGGTGALDSQPSSVDHAYAVTAVDRAGNESPASLSVYLDPGLLPPRNIQIVVEEEQLPTISWEHEGDSISGFNIAVNNEGNLLAENLTTNSYVDNQYNGGAFSNGVVQERSYYLVAKNNTNEASIAANIQLPALSVELRPDVTQNLSRGVVNTLEFRISNRGSTLQEGVNLDVLINVGGIDISHQARNISIQPHNYVDVPLAIGGYSNISDIAVLYYQLSRVYPAGSVAIHQSESIHVVNDQYPVSINVESIVRGGQANFRFQFENTSQEIVELLLAEDGESSPDITVTIEDLNDNILSFKSLKQLTGTDVITKSNGSTVARINPSTTFVSSLFSVDVPDASPEQVVVKLEIKNVRFQDAQFVEKLVDSKLRVRAVQNLSELPYVGELTDISSERVYSGGVITFTGRATSVNPEIDLSFVGLNLLLVNQGFEQRIPIQTNSHGEFTYNYTPKSNISGEIQLAVIHPDQSSVSQFHTFYIDKATLSPPDYSLLWPVSLVHHGKIKVTTGYATNLQNARLVLADQFDAPEQVVNIPENLSITFGAPLNVLAGETAYLGFSFESSQILEGTLRLYAVAYIEDVPTILGEINLKYKFEQGTTAVSFDRNPVEIGMVQGDGAFIENIQVKNSGYATINTLAITAGQSKPNWVSLTSQTNFSNFKIGQSFNLQLQIAPDLSVQPGTYHFDLDFVVDGGASRLLPVYVSVTNDDVGSVQFKVEDIYTATFDENGVLIEGVNDAKIILQNLDVSSGRYEAKTDQYGEYFFGNGQEIPAGRYSYRVSAFDHQSVTGEVVVKPGISVTERVFLMNQLISVEWSVTEIALEDIYQILLEATFETQVPFPVVVFDPLRVELPVMKQGDVFQGEFTLTNYGLITAENVITQLPKGDEFVKIEFLYPVPDRLAAGEIIVLPFRVTAKRNFEGEEDGLASGAGGYCHAHPVKTQYQATCSNETTQSGGASAQIAGNGGRCSGRNGDSNGGGGGWGWLSAGGSSSQGSSSVTTGSQECAEDDCDDEVECPDCE